MNPMMEALSQSRASNPAPTGQPPVPGTPGAPGSDPAANPMAKLEMAIGELSSKMDKILEWMSGKYQGKTPDENDGNETQEK